MSDLTTPVLEVADLAVSFDNSNGGPRIQAVNGVHMTLYPQQTLAVVGESGCGKSVTAMSTMQLIPRPPGRFDRGSILFEGRDICALSEDEMLSVRGGKIAMIFQDPMTAPIVTPMATEMPVETIPIEIERRHAHSICERTAPPGASEPRSRRRAPNSVPLNSARAGTSSTRDPGATATMSLRVYCGDHGTGAHTTSRIVPARSWSM